MSNKNIDGMDEDIGLELDETLEEDFDISELAGKSSSESDVEDDEDGLSIDEIESEDLDPTEWDDNDEDIDIEDDEGDDEDDDEDDDEEDDEEDDEDDEIKPEGNKKSLVILGVVGVGFLGFAGFMGKDILFPPAPQQSAPAPAPSVKPVVKAPVTNVTPAAPQAPQAPQAAKAAPAAPVGPKMAPAAPQVAPAAPVPAPMATSESGVSNVKVAALNITGTSVLEEKLDLLDKKYGKQLLAVSKALAESESQLKAVKAQVSYNTDNSDKLMKEISDKNSDLQKQIDTVMKDSKSLSKDLSAVKLATRNMNSLQVQSKVALSKIENVEKSISNLEKKLANVSTDMKPYFEEIAQRVEALENKKRTFVNKEDKEIAYEIDGKKRAIGFNVINATPDENMSVMMTPSRNVIVVFLNEKVIIEGKSRRVTAIEDGGYKVHFEGGYFVDGDRMEQKPTSVVKEESKKAAVAKSVKKTKAKAAKAVERKSYEGLKVAMVLNGEDFILKTKKGLFVKVSKGSTIEGYEDLGVVGEFITNEAKGMDGVLLIGKEHFLTSN